MAFLTDENLTFHRFSDGSISIGGSRRPSADNNLDDNSKNNQFVINENNKKSKKFQPAVWTTDNTNKNYPSENTNNEFQFISPNEQNINKSLQQNGSTVKLLVDDQSSKQVNYIICFYLLFV